MAFALRASVATLLAQGNWQKLYDNISIRSDGSILILNDRSSLSRTFNFLRFAYFLTEFIEMRENCSHYASMTLHDSEAQTYAELFC